jgi:hypothetical protein
MKLWLVIALLCLPILLTAATGCDLNDPDADVKKLFPQSTGYKTQYMSIAKSGGKAALDRVEKLLGDKFSGTYETIDVPYTIYSIYKGKSIIGYIHGVNQKGQYGGLQVFLALDLKGTVTAFYFQKLSAKNGKPFKAKAFTSQFIGLSLKDFDGYNVATGKGNARINAIKNPSADMQADFLATLRAVKKNLVLMREFVYKN